MWKKNIVPLLILIFDAESWCWMLILESFIILEEGGRKRNPIRFSVRSWDGESSQSPFIRHQTPSAFLSRVGKLTFSQSYPLWYLSLTLTTSRDSLHSHHSVQRTKLSHTRHTSHNWTSYYCVDTFRIFKIAKSTGNIFQSTAFVQKQWNRQTIRSELDSNNMYICTSYTYFGVSVRPSVRPSVRA
jgi:hypothetical protein